MYKQAITNRNLLYKKAKIRTITSQYLNLKYPSKG